MLSRPLWVDELHSSWVVNSSWSQLTDRAREGNQSVFYFAILKLWTAIFGHHEWSLRLPSMIAWILSLLSMAKWLLRSNDSHGVTTYFPIVAWCLAICVDRMQFFYAVEARSYAIVQLLNLWCWMQIAEIIQRPMSASKHDESDAATNRHWYVWAICASLMVELHITSGLGLAFQAVILVSTALKKRQLSSTTIACLLFVFVICAWQLSASQSTWNRRQQWASFAGDDSWDVLLNMFPILPIALPTTAALIIGILWQRLSATKQTLDLASTPPRTVRCLGIWFCAGFGPAILAFALTHFQIAPLMHYRFIIVAALPLYLCFSAMSSLVMGWLRVAAIMTTLLWMLSTQGLLELPLENWRAERRENWRTASEFIARQFSADSQTLWCYSGLIESVNLQLPITAEQNEYLSYPMRGIYQFDKSGVSVEPHALIADRKSWLKQIQQQSTIDGHSQIWIIYRGPAERLEEDLASSGISSLKLAEKIHQFDRVSVVCVELKSIK